MLVYQYDVCCVGAVNLLKNQIISIILAAWKTLPGISTGMLLQLPKVNNLGLQVGREGFREYIS